MTTAGDSASFCLTDCFHCYRISLPSHPGLPARTACPSLQACSAAVAAWAMACARTRALAAPGGGTAAAATITAGAFACSLAIQLLCPSMSSCFGHMWMCSCNPPPACCPAPCPHLMPASYVQSAPRLTPCRSLRNPYCSLDKGYCVGGACADLSRTPQALAPPINNGSSAAVPKKPGRGWH